MRLVMLGPPGAGKSTQAQRVAAKYGILHLAVGDMLRAAAASGTPVGRLVKDSMARGGLVSDDIVQAIVFEWLDGADARNGFILDGFPRTLPQAESLDRLLKGQGLALDAVIELKANDQELLDRVAARRASAATRREPQRTDDNADVLRSRIEAYHKHTAPLLDYYRKRGVLHSVDGMLSIAKVEQAVDRILTGISTEKAPDLDT